MKLKLIWFCVIFSLFPFYLFAQEIHVRRGNAGDFPTEFQGKREGDGLFFGMSDLPPGRIINLTRPELVTAGQRRVTGQILVVKQIPSQGRLRSSEIILSPQGADYFGVRSELFLVTNNSSVRWADNMPPLPPPLPSWPQVGQDQSAQQQPQTTPQQQYYPPQQQNPSQQQYPNQQYYPQQPPQQQQQQYPPQAPQQQQYPPQPPQQQQPVQQPPQEEQPQQQPPAVARFRKSTVEEYDYRMFGNGELEYELEPAQVRPPEETVTVNDVVDELEQTGSSIKKNRPGKKKAPAVPPEKEPESTPVNKEKVDFVEQEPQKLEIDVNVGVAEPPAPVISEVPVQPSLPIVEPYQEVDAAFRPRLQEKTMNPVQPGLYIQVGYFGQQQSLVKTFLTVEKWFDVKIVPSTENGQRFYRLLVGSFRDDELGLARENLRKLGLKDFFLVRY